VNLNTTITETLSKVTVVTQTITIRRKQVSLLATLTQTNCYVFVGSVAFTKLLKLSVISVNSFLPCNNFQPIKTYCDSGHVTFPALGKSSANWVVCLSVMIRAKMNDKNLRFGFIMKPWSK